VQILNSIKNQFVQLMRTGVRDDTPHGLAKQTILSNFVIVIFTAFIAIFTLVFFLNDLSALGQFAAVWALTTPLWMIANHRGAYTLARMGLLLETNLMGFVVCWQLGQETNFHFAYIAGMTTPVLLFGASEIKETVAGALLTVICYLTLKWLPNEYVVSGIVSAQGVLQMKLLVDFLIAVVIFASVFYLSLVNDDSEKRLRKTVIDLEVSHQQLETSHRETQAAQAVSQESAKMAALGVMASGIAHEINSPLGAIRLNTEMILARNKKALMPDVMIMKKAEAVVAIVKRVSQIIEGLKTFSRDSNLTELQVFSVQTVIENTLDLCREKLKSNGITLEITGEDSSLRSYGKAVEISQTLLNLVSNSFDAIVGNENSWIKISYARQGSLVELRVTDSGSGIDSSIVERIFEPFFTTKDIGKGTGLGLSIAKGLLLKHGGDLLYNANSVNTQFVIRLPISEMQTQETA
jgi:C4-dicarboxylate-specific signal transduction histidine kinase